MIQTELFVRGAPFNHHDSNTLKLVAPPKLNPLAVIVNDRAKDDHEKAISRPEKRSGEFA